MGKISFEEALRQLEEIVENLEDGSLDLDKSIEMFQKGMELSSICTKKLDDAERKVTMLIQTKTGQFKEEPFSEEV